MHKGETLAGRDTSTRAHTGREGEGHTDKTHIQDTQDTQTRHTDKAMAETHRQDTLTRDTQGT